MSSLYIVEVGINGIQFSDGTTLASDHEQDCCEYHYIDFSSLVIENFDGLVFDLSDDTFFECINNYGIALKPLNGHPVQIPGYGGNNGYYSTELRLVLQKGKTIREFDITKCQHIEET